MKDKFDRPVTVGCYLAYAVRHGDCAALCIGKVVKVTEQYVMVLGVNKGWWHNSLSLSLNDRPGRLEHGDRVLVLDNVPIDYKVLLDEVNICG